MHSILNTDDDVFVGMWLKLPNDQGGGDLFNRLLKAPDVHVACIMANMLNGGDTGGLGYVSMVEWL